MIKFLHRRHIDDEKWNRVLSLSRYETIYPHSWYLDACTEHWAAFVMNEYECIMPVAFRSKLGLRYTYQPRFCQQLGIYSELRVDNEVSRMFLHALNKRFKLGDYAFNEGNLLDDEPGFDVTDNANYILDIREPYETILKGYTENCRRNIKKALNTGLEFTDSIDIHDLVYLKKMNDSAEHDDAHYRFLTRMFKTLQNQNRVKVFGVKLETHICAAAIFAFSGKRMHYLLSFSSETGKKRRAMFMVIDSVITMYANENLTLDFEGSNIPSIARFFRGFGAKPQIYQRVSFQNTTSKLIEIIKRG
ncbi:MAG: GNAT family N-acetyltransferase [Bacteroidales bacterium]